MGRFILVMRCVRRFLWEWKDIEVLEMVCCDLFGVWDAGGEERNLYSLQ